MIRQSPAPEALAASTNSFSRSDRNVLGRANPVQKRSEDDGDALRLALAHVDRDREQHGETRERQDEVREPHQRVVDPAAEVAGQAAPIVVPITVASRETTSATQSDVRIP